MTFNETIQSDKPVPVDFFAQWRGPCKTMAHILKDLKAEVSDYDQASIIKIDTDKNIQAANAYQVQHVPTLILFKKGKIFWQQSDIIPKAGLASLIRQHQ